ncbi:phosphotransferase family protein [Nocardia colli]|uniref:Phosphotransferase family protein n=1 Tax=Nocardia colli TaxID=2545717 RepID=A0A5N0EHS7_9NOCA|nr:phosphotransferase family protein [Nocardia colli]KAA8888546.1 phosphotransferase family protein [Nocardia colli]
MSDGNPDPTARRQLTVSARNAESIAAALSRWLATRIAADQPPEISALSSPEGSGMSSSTVFFDARWTVGGLPVRESFVARMAPELDSFPVFETYDLARQFDIMVGVAAATDVPMPELCWLETDESPLGATFFVMKRIVGRIPADNPPYVFTGWLFDATVEERARLAANTVEVISKIHAIPEPAVRFPMLTGPGQALRRHVDSVRALYRWGLVDDGFRIPIVERGFEWLEARWPAEPGPDVLLWGDARPGNILYRGFEPVGVLDWELAALGPREIDLAWLIFMHRFFQDIATRFDHPGLPDFLCRADVVTKYEELSGHSVRDLDFHLVYAALRHAIGMARIKRRMIHFGEDTDTPDRDDYVMHRAGLTALLDGTYAWD